MPRFVLLFDNERVKTFDIDEGVVTIGRLPENSISIVNMGVSRRHARIERDADNNFVLIDHSSLNGTFLNDKKVSRAVLHNEDRIGIGKYTILFEETQADTEDERDTKSIVFDDPASPPLEQEAAEPEGAEPASESPDTREDRSEGPAGESEASTCPVLIETTKHVVYKLDKSYMTLGNSEDDDVFIDGHFIDRAHAAIERQDDGLWLSTQKLLSKVKVNGKKVRNHQLAHKDRIQIAGSTFRYMEKE